MITKTWIRMCVAALVLIASTAAVSARDCRHETPMPGDVRIEPPGPEVPESIARYSGAWSGAWLNEKEEPTLCHNIVVEKVWPNGMVQLAYAHGYHKAWGIETPSYLRVGGRIVDGVLKVKLGPDEHAIYKLDGDTLAAEFSDGTQGSLRRIESVSELGCSRSPALDLQPLGLTRKRLQVEDLQRPATVKDGLIHNSNYAPPENAQPARHALRGAISVSGGTWFQSSAGCLGLQHEFGAFTAKFFTFDGALVPVERGIIVLPVKTNAYNIILSPGRVWSEAADNGYSRGAFPFVLVSNSNNETYNGVASFLYDDKGVSHIWFQISQETTPWNRFNAWGSLTAKYTPLPEDEFADAREDYQDELNHALDIRPWSALKEELPKAVYEGFLGAWGQEHVSASGLLRDNVLYMHSCQTRLGPFPYCRHMRHGAYSATKSLGAAITLFRLAKKYGDEVMFSRVKDFVNITAPHNGWDRVRFVDILNMATGIGNKQPIREPLNPLADEPPPDEWWFKDMTAKERLDVAFGRYDNLPWGPGEVMRYNSSQTFVLVAAMDKFLKTRKGPGADLWDMVMKEVLRPIGVFHFPILRTIEEGERRGLPIFSDGSYPTVEDAAKIARLFHAEGRHGVSQLLSKTAVREALFRGSSQGLSAGGNGRLRQGRYNLSFWSVAYKASQDCTFQVPYMAGYGGVIVAILPNGVTALRFADEDIYELRPLLDAAWAARPVCPTTGEPLAADAIAPTFSGATLYTEKTHIYFSANGNAFFEAEDEYRSGYWRVNDAGRLCLRYPTSRGGIESCYSVYKNGDTYVFRPVDRLTETRYTLVRSNPYKY